jgi:hypothetical protein
MFPIKAKDVLPIEKLVIHSVAVRGQLGPIAVWVTNENERQGQAGEYNFRLSPRHWTKIYEGTHAPSQRTYQVLDLRDKPIVLRPGQVRSIYIHSTLEGDEAIVYDNSIPVTNTLQARRRPNNGLVRRPRFEDNLLSIYSGKAHLSPTPFGQMPIWGWGNAWRDHREFVGQLQYGIVYKLWNPELHNRFGGKYQGSVQALLACQRRFESPISMLPDECLFYILNMCRWDWFQDTPDALKTQRRTRKRRLRLLEEQERVEQQRLEEEQAATAAAAAPAGQETNGARSCCDQLLSRDGGESNGGNRSNNRDADGDEEFHDAEEHEHDADVEDADIEDDDDEEEEARAMMIAPRVRPDANGSESDSSEGVLEDDEDDDDDDDEDFDDEEEWVEDVAAMNDVRVQGQEAAADEDDESEWERQNGYRADNFNFNFRDVSSDEDEEEDDGAGNAAAERQAWFRRHFARVHILRGLAQGEQDVVVDMNLG